VVVLFGFAVLIGIDKQLSNYFVVCAFERASLSSFILCSCSLLMLSLLSLISYLVNFLCDFISPSVIVVYNSSPSIRIISLEPPKPLHQWLIAFTLVTRFTSLDCPYSTFTSCSHMLFFDVPCASTVYTFRHTLQPFRRFF